MNVQPVILCGGSGTRLWPLSREQYPKQLISLVGEDSLLQGTLRRGEALAQTLQSNAMTVAAPLIVSNEEHRFLVAEQARQLGIPLRDIILEPIGRNTAPALTLAALAIQQNGDDPVLLVLPADHVMTAPQGFFAATALAADLADAGAIVTFGIVPQRPETGYGYIHKGASSGTASWRIAAFVEKPDVVTAADYVGSGQYLWNSGMFMVRASVWLKAIGMYCPDILEACRNACVGAKRDHDFFRVDAKAFAACPADSIDYAVMERVTGDDVIPSAVVALEAGWSDVGAWSAVWEVNSPDVNGNVLRGDVCVVDTHNSLMLSEHRLVAGVGLDNVVVVETADAVLVAHKDRAQDVKRVVETLKATKRSEHLTHRRVYRPWGYYESIDYGPRFQVKRINVKSGAALSLQMHHHRAEHWVVVKGTARVTRGEDVFLVSENESTYIPIGVQHRLENPGKLPLEIIEIQSGAYLGEDDIVRFEDVYGR